MRRIDQRKNCLVHLCSHQNLVLLYVLNRQQDVDRCGNRPLATQIREQAPQVLGQRALLQIAKRITDIARGASIDSELAGLEVDELRPGALDFQTIERRAANYARKPRVPEFDVSGKILEIRPPVGIVQAHASDREIDAKLALAVTERKTAGRAVEDELSG